MNFPERKSRSLFRNQLGENEFIEMINFLQLTFVRATHERQRPRRHNWTYCLWGKIITDEEVVHICTCNTIMPGFRLGHLLREEKNPFLFFQKKKKRTSFSLRSHPGFLIWLREIHLREHSVQFAYHFYSSSELRVKLSLFPSDMGALLFERTFR